MYSIVIRNIMQIVFVYILEVWTMRVFVCLCMGMLMLFGGQLSSQADDIFEGLILYFGFNYERADQIQDWVGHENNGTLMGGAEITHDEKVHGVGSLEILNENASVQVESFDKLDEYQDNSFLFWIKFLQGPNGAWSQIIAKPAPGEDRSPGIWVRPNAVGIHYRFNPGNTGADYVGPKGNNTQFQIDRWYHIAGVKKGGTLSIYTDGDLRGTYDVSQPHAQGADKLYIGKSPKFRAATFYLDELFIFERALDVDEVSEIKFGLPLPVEPKDKLTTTWGQLKRGRK